jgi:hypothetical protein
MRQDDELSEGVGEVEIRDRKAGIGFDVVIFVVVPFDRQDLCMIRIEERDDIAADVP